MLRTAMLLMVLSGANANDARVETILCSSSFSAGAWDLLALARFGQTATERAAFVVRAADGSLTLVQWPFQSKFHRASYQGAIPRGTVGIVHTHPNAHPSPSAGDRQLAKRMAMPVLVLTRTAIAWTDGEHNSSRWMGAWTPDDAPRCGQTTAVVASLR